jgi:hypothetical protein
MEQVDKLFVRETIENELFPVRMQYNLQYASARTCEARVREGLAVIFKA